MKKIFLLMLCLLLAVLALAGCGTAAPAKKPADETPVSEEPAKAREEAAALSPYFPAERITLPAGSKVIGVSNDFADKDDDDSAFWETTMLQLAMTKTEAIAHFTPMLKKGEVDHFEVSKDTSEHIPWQIEGDYPEVTNYVELYASYPYASDGVFISIIKVTLFTKDDNETIAVAWIEVNYTRKPTSGPVISYEAYKEKLEKQVPDEPAAETKLGALRQHAQDAGCEVFDDWTYGVFTAIQPAGGFDMRFEGAIISILEYSSAGKAQEFIDEQGDTSSYSFYSDDRFVAVYMAAALSDEAAAKAFIGKMFKAVQ